jgi:energy-coupling factor transporter ATP-binding protein EcfA2
MPPAPNYDEPFYWWGHRWETPDPLGAAELLRNGTIDPISGALLWSELARRKSIAVIGGPAGAGKSTLLWALLDFLAPKTRRIYLRGNFEAFAFLNDDGYDASSSVLLANELSPHLPVYVWGATLARLLDRAVGEPQVAATAHAESIAEFVSLLASSPMRIPTRQIARFDLVALVKQSDEARSGRFLKELWRLSPTSSGIEMHQIYDRLGNDISLEDFTNPSRLPTPINAATPSVGELYRRASIMADIRRGSIRDLPEFPIVCT